MEVKYQSKAKKVILPVWKPIEVNADESIGVDLNPPQYSFNYINTEHPINHMPLIIKGNGEPWNEANLYLLHLLEKQTISKVSVNMAGINSKADDLVDYLRFLEDENLDFTASTRKKLFRPTIRYRAELGRQIGAGLIADSTASRRWGAVVSFYRTNEEELFFAPPEYPPFDDQTRNVSYKNSYGLEKSKQIISTKQAVKVTKKAHDNGFILDGAQLIPLTKPEQILLLKELNKSSNIEMKLIHWIAIFTGARIQSICTLRIKHIFKTIPKDKLEISIPAGLRTGIDTKNDKQLILLFPVWLIEKLIVYYNSERYKKRLSLFSQNWGDDNYLFLSKSGLPFYKSKYDHLKGYHLNKITKQPLDANSVRQFVKSIRNSIQLNNPEFYYRFHDLRATYGMNLVDDYRGDINTGRMTYLEALKSVMDRMGHSSLTTTEIYLQYRQQQEISKKFQSSWEDEFLAIIEFKGNINE